MCQRLNCIESTLCGHFIVFYQFEASILGAGPPEKEHALVKGMTSEVPAAPVNQ